ncbi:MAG: BMP family ABC transporter substrate-binding protein [bacterium]|nr:BMP family ABC transporter substrate-binding protein [bacterium]
MKCCKIVRYLGVVTLIALLAIVGSVEAKEAKDYKVVLVLPGPINDQSWNATNYSGLVACNEQLGTNIEYAENVQQSDFESTFRNYGERGYDLVIAAGTQFDNAGETIAPLYPETFYLIVNGAKSNGENLTGVTIREWESGYLAGVLAGLLTESGIIGEMGGFPNPLMIDTLNGVTAGAKSVNPGFKKAIRAYANSWSDIAKGKEIGVSMIEGGADVLFAYANQAGLGTLMAAQEAEKKFIGFASNQNDTDPHMIPGSVIYKYDRLYLFVVAEFIKGQLKAEVVTSGLSEGIIDVIFSESATQEMQDAVAKAREGILSGDIPKPEGEE